MKDNLDRYVIVCLFEKEVLEFHEKITKEVCDSFGVKRQKLPAHFTIKAPFEHNDISEIEKITEDFCNSNTSYPITISGYNHFRDAVVYMDIKTSDKALETYNNYISSLKKVNWLEWKKNEKGHRVFHCTIVSRLKSDKFEEVWNYVNKYPYSFESYFDNISILRWNGHKWDTHKKYLLQK